MAGIGKYKKGAKFTLKSGNAPSFKMMGSTTPIMHSEEAHKKEHKTETRSEKVTKEGLSEWAGKKISEQAPDIELMRKTGGATRKTPLEHNIVDSMGVNEKETRKHKEKIEHTADNKHAWQTKEEVGRKGMRKLPRYKKELETALPYLKASPNPQKISKHPEEKTTVKDVVKRAGRLIKKGVKKAVKAHHRGGKKVYKTVKEGVKKAVKAHKDIAKGAVSSTLALGKGGKKVYKKVKKALSKKGSARSGPTSEGGVVGAAKRVPKPSAFQDVKKFGLDAGAVEERNAKKHNTMHVMGRKGLGGYDEEHNVIKATKKKEAKKKFQKKKSNISKSKGIWANAPKSGTQARVDFYKKHNLKMDDTTKLA